MTRGPFLAALALLVSTVALASPPVAVTPADAATPTAADVDPSARPPLETAPPESPPPPPEPHLWDGNQTSIMVGAAMNWLNHSPSLVDPQGVGFRIAGRVGAISQFVDAEIGFERVAHGGQAGAGLVRNDLGFQVGTHPAFPIIVFNDFWNDVISGFHGYVGASVVRATLTGADALLQAQVPGTTEHSEWQPCIYVGSGVDIPISPRNKDWGIWLTPRANVRWMWFGPKQPELGLTDSQFTISFSYRSNSTSWARIPKPF
jgi:hypothetical protein